jgi:hypothetical protein
MVGHQRFLPRQFAPCIGQRLAFLRQSGAGLFHLRMGGLCASLLRIGVQRKEHLPLFHHRPAFSVQAGDPSGLRRGDHGIIALAIAQPAMIDRLGTGGHQHQGQQRP